MAWAQLAGAARKHARASEGALKDAERDRWHRSFLWSVSDKPYLLFKDSKTVMSVYNDYKDALTTVSICQYKIYIYINFSYLRLPSCFCKDLHSPATF